MELEEPRSTQALSDKCKASLRLLSIYEPAKACCGLNRRRAHLDMQMGKV
jgi:hypothetical protein